MGDQEVDRVEENTDEGSSFATVSDAVAEIRRLRAENAAKRVRSRDQETKMAEFEAWKLSQMTEADKIAAERDKYKAELTETLTAAYADKFNVPADRRRFITGTTKEEIEEAAKLLGDVKPEKVGEETGQVPPTQPKAGLNLFPGVRGTPVGSKGAGGTDFNAVLRDQLAR